MRADKVERICARLSESSRACQAEGLKDVRGLNGKKKAEGETARADQVVVTLCSIRCGGRLTGNVAWLDDKVDGSRLDFLLGF